MAITVLSDLSTASNTRTLSCTIPSLATNDVVAALGITWDQSVTLAVPGSTGSVIPFQQRATISQQFRTQPYIWAAKATGSGTNVVVSTAPTGGASIHNLVVIVFPAADGYDLATTPNVLQTASVSPPSGTLAGAAGNIGVVLIGDWDGNDGATRAWRLSATEDMYQFSGGNSTQYAAHCTLTGASNSVGLSAPSTGGATSVVALEVLSTGGGGGGSTKLYRPQPIPRAPIIRASSF